MDSGIERGHLRFREVVAPGEAPTELVGEDGRYEDTHRLCYGRGPEGTDVELAEKLG